MRSELIPLVESRHAVDPTKRVLLGQSLGGNFALWSAQEAPDLFWARIASNPGAAVGKPAFFAHANTGQLSDLRVIVASSARDTEARRNAASAWSQAWQSRNDAPWSVQWVPIENGTHAATIAEIYRRALLEIFNAEMRSDAR